MKYHYVYRITNKELNKHYYGVRSSKVEPKLDLGIKYFSSSHDKDFINEQKINNSIFKYKVIKIFETREEAMKLEIFLHKKFNVGLNKSFYNLCSQSSTSFSNISEFSKQKIKLTLSSKLENGLSITQNAQMKRLIKTENGNKIYKNALTYNKFYGYSAAMTRKEYQHEINKKVSETKKNKTEATKQLELEKFRKTMSVIEENGLTKAENKGKHHSFSMKNRTKEEKEISKMKFLETMNKIGSDGLSGFDRRALKRKENSEKKKNIK